MKLEFLNLYSQIYIILCSGRFNYAPFTYVLKYFVNSKLSSIVTVIVEYLH